MQPDLSGRRAAVADALERLGLEAQLIDPADIELEPDRILWLEGGPAWFRQIFSALRSTPKDRRPFVVFWHSEPLPPSRAAAWPRQRLHAREIAKMVLRADRISDPYSNARWLCRLRGEGLLSLLLVSTAGGHEFLEEQGIVSTFVPLALLPGDGRDLGLERDVDVLFLGSQDVPRRRRLIGWLRRRGVPIVAVGDWGEATGYWGERRTELLNRTKILLNLPRHGGLLSGRRMILGMANKALLVAEPIYRPEPYQAGVHFVSSELADMPEVIAAYLDDFKARDKIAAAGHDFVRNHLTLEPTVERILTLVADRSRDDAR